MHHALAAAHAVAAADHSEHHEDWADHQAAPSAAARSAALTAVSASASRQRVVMPRWPWHLLWHLLWNLIAPPRCITCRRRGTLLCPDCLHALPMLPPNVCRRCAAPRLRTTHKCRACARLSSSLHSVRAAYCYAGAARTAVHVLKFGAGRQAAAVLGELVRRHVKHRPLRAELVIPVPLAPSRQRQRGYNQAALLAEQLTGAIGGQLITDALTREDRPAQSTLGAAERLVNLHGSIRCARPDVVRARRVLLVDDVMTTGATLSACADALAASGARQVLGLVFARTL